MLFRSTVDFGGLNPQGVYTGPKDWNHAIVSQLICERRLAPFYRPLEDYEDDWSDDQILASRKVLSEGEPGSSETWNLRQESTHSSHNNTSKGSHSKRPLAKETIRCPEAAIYRGAVECPICFLVCYLNSVSRNSHLNQCNTVLSPQHKPLKML